MDRMTDKPKAICPFNFFKVGGIKITDNTEDKMPEAKVIRRSKSPLNFPDLT